MEQSELEDRRGDAGDPGLGIRTKQVHLRCADLPLVGEKGLLRIKKKRGKWIADITMTLPEVPLTDGRGIMGVDLGINESLTITTPI